MAGERRIAWELVLLGMGLFITLIWGVGVTVQVILPKHVVPTEVHAVMLVVAGAFFGGGAIAGRRKNGS